MSTGTREDAAPAGGRHGHMAVVWPLLTDCIEDPEAPMTRLPFAAFALVAAGCTGHDMMTSMGDHGAAVDRHLAAATADVDRHRVAIDTAGTLGAMAGEEAAHAARMEDHVLAMTGEMADMMDCGRGEATTMDAMMDSMVRMGDERAAHMDRMAGMATVGAALDEEARHHERMTWLLADVDADMGSMMDGAGAMSCSH